MLFANFITDIFNDSGKELLVAAVVGTITTVGSFIYGRYRGRYQAQRDWESKEFLHRIIVSLNSFQDDTLRIRTVMEDSLDTVFLNQIAIEKVMTAAKRCSPGQPILPIDPADRWYLLNFVLNAIAEHFVDGHIKKDAGLPVTTIRYAVFLTAETEKEMRIRKIRAMLIREELLRDFPYMETMPTLENAWHDQRILTLRVAAELYQREPDNFLMLEVCV